MIPQDPVPLSISITPEVPAYFTGVSSYIDLPYVDLLDFSKEWLPVMEAYTRKEPMRGFSASHPNIIDEYQLADVGLLSERLIRLISSHLN